MLFHAKNPAGSAPKSPGRDNKDYPKDSSFTDLQLVWMHLQCPARASLKGVCKSFIRDVDRVLGTPYEKLYRPRTATAEDLAIAMASIAAAQHLGILIVDEIQNLLSGTSGGAEEVLNFFVELINKMHVPIVLVGTPKARRLLKEVRQARRGTGEGDVTWERMRESDAEWDLFTKALWQYQYVRTPVERTAELQHVLYEESQGITDFAVKIFILAQVRAMLSKAEMLDEEFLRDAARKDLSMLQPLLQALRDGDVEAISQFEDVSYKDFEDCLSAAEGEIDREEALAAVSGQQADFQLRDAEEKIKSVVALLEKGQVDPETADRVTRSAMKELGLLASEAELFQLSFQMAMDGLANKMSRADKDQGPSKAQKRAKKQDEPDDLRAIVKSGAESGMSGYEALKAAGVIKPPVRTGSKDQDMIG